MDRFVERTQVTGGSRPRRYLWTDAFAVRNLLAMASATGESSHVEVALQLIDQVHHVLGRHRPDDSRRGWISGLSDADGEAHPTRGGLRIGKPLPERGPHEAPDERREWDRDGQYFHYLTRWMQALDAAARALQQPAFCVWGRELAVAAHRGFAQGPSSGGRMRMCWKASIDLSRPQVSAMGQHDPLDGFLTCLELDVTAAALQAPGPSLAAVAGEFSAMLDADALATADPLGIGGLLMDADRAERLMRAGALVGHETLLPGLIEVALVGLRSWTSQPDLGLPASRRLAFREIGLAIGLAAVPRLAPDLAAYAPLRAEVEAFWLRPEHRRADTWRAHEDINDVMLATSLLAA